MISEIYTKIGEAYEKKKYYKVIVLVEGALKVPKFGVDRNIMYQYANSLIKTHRVEDGIKVLRILKGLDKHPKMTETVDKILKRYDEQQKIQLPLEEFLAEGYKLEEGLAVFLKPDCKFLYEEDNHIKYLSSPFMIWKIVDGCIFAFPIEDREIHGHILFADLYFKNTNQTVYPSLVSFRVEDISHIDRKLGELDYTSVIKDLYERYCVLNTIQNNPKNYFVTEIEKNFLISVGDIISIYDCADRVRRYYYIIAVDESEGPYKGVAITHRNGEIYLKNTDIIEIPTSSYIMGKLNISEENRQRLEKDTADLIGPKR